MCSLSLAVPHHTGGMSNPNRVPEGSPEGGQFARGGAKPESTQTIADREWENRAGLSASEVLEA